MAARTPDGGNRRPRNGGAPRSRAVITTPPPPSPPPPSPPPDAPPAGTRPAEPDAGAAPAPPVKERQAPEAREAPAAPRRETAPPPEPEAAVAAPVVPEPPGTAQPPTTNIPVLPEGTGRIGKILHDLRPRVITGGMPITPLLLIGGINVVDGFDLNAFNVLLPEIRDYFGVGLAGITILTTIVSILAIALAVPMGYLSDRVNRVWLMVGGAVVMGLMTISTAFAWSFVALGVFRFGSRLGTVLTPSEQALLADYYPPHTRGAVFSFHEMSNRVGNAAGPLMAGLLGALFVWQFAFVVIGIFPLVLAVVMALLLKEPVRGEQERRAMGADEEAAKTGEAPPSWTESWRIAKNVRALRRLYMAIPFLVGGGLTVGTILPLFYEEVFGLGPSARGAIQAGDEPVRIVGLIIGGLVVNRLLRYRPGRVIGYAGLMAVLTAISFTVTALSPTWWLAVGFSYVRAFFQSIIQPAIVALLAMIIPPRARGFALSAIALFAAPGFLVFLAFGQIGDALGLRAGLMIMTPVYLIGAVLLASAAPTVDADIRSAQAASIAHLAAREARQKGQAKMLLVRDLDVHYDQVQILFNVDFEVDEGEIIALLGTNGAGKSTLLRAISGTTPPSNGAIVFDGEDITRLPSSAHAARGIIQVPGGRGVFPGLTVAENLKIAAWLYRGDNEYVKSATETVLGRFPALQQRINEEAGNLSGGEQQMLTLAQAFLSRPRLLMIDELSLGLAPTIVEQLLGIVKAIAEAGTTIILVEQSVNLALTISDRAVFMEKGEIKFTGSTGELMARPDILRSVFLKGAGGGGGGAIASYGARSRQYMTDGTDEEGIALEVRSVTKRFGGVTALPGVDLTLEEGKIVGLIGPNGAGKTTLFDIISGFVQPDAGQVLLFGDDITGLSPDERSKIGLARSFQDARLFPSLTVTENIAVALERHLTSKSTVSAALHLPMVAKSEKSIERRIDRLIRLMHLQDFRDKFVRELSTGSRRIVDLACVMACDPKVLLLDEPSSGIAQSEAEELAPLLQRIKWETGCSILIIEHDMPLLSSIADELVALDLGTVVTRGAPRDVLEHPRVVESYLGTAEEAIHRSGQLE